MLLLLLPLFRFLFLSGRNPKISLAPPYFRLSLLLFLLFFVLLFLVDNVLWLLLILRALLLLLLLLFWILILLRSKSFWVCWRFVLLLFIYFIFVFFFFRKYFWLFTPHCLRFTPTYFNYLFVCFGGACACITTDNIPTNYLFFFFWFMKRKIFNWFNLYWIIVWLDL